MSPGSKVGGVLLGPLQPKSKQLFGQRGTSSISRGYNPNVNCTEAVMDSGGVRICSDFAAVCSGKDIHSVDVDQLRRSLAICGAPGNLRSHIWMAVSGWDEIYVKGLYAELKAGFIVSVGEPKTPSGSPNQNSSGVDALGRLVDPLGRLVDPAQGTSAVDGRGPAAIKNLSSSSGGVHVPPIPGVVKPGGNSSGQSPWTDRGSESDSRAQMSETSVATSLVGPSTLKLSAAYVARAATPQRAESVIESVARDVRRTFPDSLFYQDKKNLYQLGCVIATYALSNKDIGYCQGMTFIGGHLLQLTGSEEETFWFLSLLMIRYNLQSLYREDVPLVHLLIHQYRKLLAAACPDVSHHLSVLGIEPELYAVKWFFSLFTYSFPTEQVHRLWDFLMAACPPIQRHTGFQRAMVLLCVSIVGCLRERLLASESPDIALIALNSCSSTLSVSDIVAVACELDRQVAQASLEQYRSEWAMTESGRAESHTIAEAELDTVLDPTSSVARMQSVARTISPPLANSPEPSGILHPQKVGASGMDSAGGLSPMHEEHESGFKPSVSPDDANHSQGKLPDAPTQLLADVMRSLLKRSGSKSGSGDLAVSDTLGKKAHFQVNDAS